MRPGRSNEYRLAEVAAASIEDSNGLDEVEAEADYVERAEEISFTLQQPVGLRSEVVTDHGRAGRYQVLYRVGQK